LVSEKGKWGNVKQEREQVSAMSRGAKDGKRQDFAPGGTRVLRMCPAQKKPFPSVHFVFWPKKVGADLRRVVKCMGSSMGGAGGRKADLWGCATRLCLVLGERGNLPS